MTYDALNRMTEWRQVGSGAPKVEKHIYRGAEWHRAGTVVKDGMTPPQATAFLYDGDNVCADFSEHGGALVVEAFYVTPFLDQNLLMIKDGRTYWYSQDGLGSVRTLTDAAGGVVNRYDYTAFGETWAMTTSETVSQRYTYTGRPLNPFSGTYDLRYRTQDPVTGRFFQRDPKGYIFPLGVHLYSYASNQPINKIDPCGKWASAGHVTLTRTACNAVGICPACCSHIIIYNVQSDSEGFEAIGWWLGLIDTAKPEQHSMVSGSLSDKSEEQQRKARQEAADKTAKFIKEKKSNASAFAKQCACISALGELGRGLHAQQDKSAHQGWSTSPYAGLPITDEEHRKDLSYDDPAKQPTRWIRATLDSYDFLMGAKDILGCCCSFPPAKGQAIPCQTLCDKKKYPPDECCIYNPEQVFGK